MRIRPRPLITTGAHMLGRHVGIVVGHVVTIGRHEVHAPDVNVSPSQLVLDSWDPDFPQDDGTIAHDPAAYLDEILLDREGGELRIREPRCARPHLGLVRVPMVARLNDFMLNPMEDVVECFDSVLVGSVRRVKIHFFCRSYCIAEVNIDPRVINFIQPTHSRECRRGRWEQRVNMCHSILSSYP